MCRFMIGQVFSTNGNDAEFKKYEPNGSDSDSGHKGRNRAGVVFIYTSVYLQPSKLVSNIQMLL